MPTDKPARKALPSARPASGGTAAGGNDLPTMPSSTDTPPQPGRGSTGDPVQQSLPSRQRSASTSSSASSEDLNDDLVVISSTQANSSDLTAGARNESQAPQPKGASAPSSSRKRDYDNITNASAHANDAGAGIAAQGYSANQARTGDASIQPTKYQRILPRASGGGVWQPTPGWVPPPPSEVGADEVNYENYMQFCEFQEWMAEGMPRMPDGTPKQPSQMSNSMPGNLALPRRVQGGGPLTVGASDVNLPAPVGPSLQRQIEDASTPAPKPANNPVNNPASNAANVPAGLRDAPSSGPATIGQAQNLPEELSAQINGLMALSNRNERARQERSMQDFLLIRSQVDTHSRQIESFQQTFKDLQAAHVRDEAARNEEMKSIQDLFVKKQQEFAKKADEPARQNQRKRGGPSSRD